MRFNFFGCNNEEELVCFDHDISVCVFAWCIMPLSGVLKNQWRVRDQFMCTRIIKRAPSEDIARAIHIHRYKRVITALYGQFDLILHCY